MEQTENQLIGLKKQKLNNLLKLGVNPYPAKSFFTHKIEKLIKEKDTIGEQKVFLVGRIFSLRRQGKVGFSNIGDDSGKIQLYIKKDNVGEENYEIFKLCDIGDFIQVEGIVFTTHSGEFSLKVEKLTVLCKTIRPLPIVKEKNVDGKLERYDEFVDTELRYRKRYLDLLLNPSVREDFKKRSLIISTIRKLLDEKGFLEVDTPILQALYGGANAKPFFTKYNSLNRNFFLRIATELYLKRLIVGGFDKVYEIGKNFRNEGMDRTHNPEFTLMELYQSFGDISSMLEICEYLIYNTAKNLNCLKVVFNHHEINLEVPFKKASMSSLIKEYTGEDFSDFNFERIKNFCQKNEIEFDISMGAGALVAEIFDKFVEHKLIQPTFVLDYPKEISPLAKANLSDDNLTERFELFIGGKEIANAFSELNDPLEQRRRLEEQAKKREMGDLEANQIDEDFLEALEYGMPPTGGLGIGIDRLLMLFLSKESIKDVILFPQMRM